MLQSTKPNVENFSETLMNLTRYSMMHMGKLRHQKNMAAYANLVDGWLIASSKIELDGLLKKDICLLAGLESFSSNEVSHQQVLSYVQQKIYNGILATTTAFEKQSRDRRFLEALAKAMILDAPTNKKAFVRWLQENAQTIFNKTFPYNIFKRFSTLTTEEVDGLYELKKSVTLISSKKLALSNEIAQAKSILTEQIEQIVLAENQTDLNEVLAGIFDEQDLAFIQEAVFIVVKELSTKFAVNERAVEFLKGLVKASLSQQTEDLTTFTDWAVMAGRIHHQLLGFGDRQPYHPLTPNEIEALFNFKQCISAISEKKLQARHQKVEAAYPHTYQVAIAKFRDAFQELPTAALKELCYNILRYTYNSKSYLKLHLEQILKKHGIESKYLTTKRFNIAFQLKEQAQAMLLIELFLNAHELVQIKREQKGGETTEQDRYYIYKALGDAAKKQGFVVTKEILLEMERLQKVIPAELPTEALREKIIGALTTNNQKMDEDIPEDFRLELQHLHQRKDKLLTPTEPTVGFSLFITAATTAAVTCIAQYTPNLPQVLVTRSAVNLLAYSAPYTDQVWGVNVGFQLARALVGLVDNGLKSVNFTSGALSILSIMIATNITQGVIGERATKRFKDLVLYSFGFNAITGVSSYVVPEWLLNHINTTGSLVFSTLSYINPVSWLKGFIYQSTEFALEEGNLPYLAVGMAVLSVAALHHKEFYHLYRKTMDQFSHLFASDDAIEFEPVDAVFALPETQPVVAPYLMLGMSKKAFGKLNQDQAQELVMEQQGKLLGNPSHSH